MPFSASHCRLGSRRGARYAPRRRRSHAPRCLLAVVEALAVAVAAVAALAAALVALALAAAAAAAALTVVLTAIAPSEAAPVRAPRGTAAAGAAQQVGCRAATQAVWPLSRAACAGMMRVAQYPPCSEGRSSSPQTRPGRSCVAPGRGRRVARWAAAASRPAARLTARWPARRPARRPQHGGRARRAGRPLRRRARLGAGRPGGPYGCSHPP